MSAAGSSVCSSCGRAGLSLRSGARFGLGPTCSRCLERARAEPCSICTVVRPLRRRAADGSAICGSCVAGQLGEERRSAKRESIIDAVRRIEPELPVEVVSAAVDQACDITWRLTKVADALAASPDCLISGETPCPVEIDRLATALISAGASRVAGFVCTRCGKTGRCQAVRGGEAICAKCSPKRQALCGYCGRTAAVVAVWAAGAVCSTCYQRRLASNGDCEGCGQRRRIDPRDTSGRRLCSDCAGLPPLAVCEGCGGEDRIWRNRRCFACNLSDRLHQLLAGPDGEIPVELAGLQAKFAATGSPKQMLRWLGRPEISSTLAAIARGELAANHDSIDALGASPWVAHLRQVLVAADVLPARDEVTAGLENWLNAKLADIDDLDDRQLVATFATWWVLRRRRARAARRSTRSDEYPRQVIKRAIEVLDWLRVHDRTLASATQADIDLWLASGPPIRRYARDFLSWAHRCRLCSQLVIVHRPSPLPVPTADMAQLTTIAKRLLVDDTVALVDRVAGLLVICYGQPASRIAELTADRIATHDGMTTLRLGSTDIELPEPIAPLVRELAAHRKGYAVIDAPDAGWLFPGARPGRPLTAKYLQIRLGRLGIRVRDARSTMLLDYGGTLPPAVIADMLGLHHGTAIRWVKAAAGDWNAYAAARARPAS